MESVLEIVVLGRSARNGSAIKNRQPLSTMYVKCDTPLDNFYADIIKDELNIKSVDFTNEVDNLVSYSFKPQLKTVGPKYGKQLGEIRAALVELDGNAAKAELDANGAITLNLASGDVTLATEDLLIEAKQKEGFFTVSDHGVTVALDTTLTDELIEEGFVREIVSKIQTMRKEANFNVTDHITVTMNGSEKVIAVVNKLSGDIAGDTLADSIIVGNIDGYSKDWDINGEKLTIGVKCI
jgi:isoleucyl-tRNA synthetase